MATKVRKPDEKPVVGPREIPDLLVPFPAKTTLDKSTLGFVPVGELKNYGLEPGLIPRRRAKMSPKEAGAVEAQRDSARKVAAITASESRYFLTSFTPDNLRMNALFREAGIGGEKILPEPVDGKYLVEKEGVALKYVDFDPPKTDGSGGSRADLKRLMTMSLRRKDVTAVLRSIAQNVGKMHALGISHPRLYEDSIVLLAGNRTGIIDANVAKRVNVDWESPKSIFEAFQPDYVALNNMFVEVGLKNDMIEGVFERVVNRYPAKDQVKAHVIKLLYQEGYAHGKTFGPNTARSGYEIEGMHEYVYPKDEGKMD
jgi:hypothetical protein